MPPFLLFFLEIAIVLLAHGFPMPLESRGNVWDWLSSSQGAKTKRVDECELPLWNWRKWLEGDQVRSSVIKDVMSLPQNEIIVLPFHIVQQFTQAKKVSSNIKSVEE